MYGYDVLVNIFIPQTEVEHWILFACRKPIGTAGSRLDYLDWHIDCLDWHIDTCVYCFCKFDYSEINAYSLLRLFVMFNNSNKTSEICSFCEANFCFTFSFTTRVVFYITRMKINVSNTRLMKFNNAQGT